MYGYNSRDTTISNKLIVQDTRDLRRPNIYTDLCALFNVVLNGNI